VLRRELRLVFVAVAVGDDEPEGLVVVSVRVEDAEPEAVANPDQVADALPLAEGDAVKETPAEALLEPDALRELLEVRDRVPEPVPDLERLAVDEPIEEDGEVLADRDADAEAEAEEDENVGVAVAEGQEEVVPTADADTLGVALGEAVVERLLEAEAVGVRFCVGAAD
jgi:hypothetical protein